MISLRRQSSSVPRVRHKTLGLRGLVLVLAVFAAGAFGSIFFLSSEQPAAAAYPVSCVTYACREAYDRAAASQEAAAQLASQANTLEGEIARLNAEITALEADIYAKQLIADDLSAQIILNQSKLTLQRSALAHLLVDIHFDTAPDAILILASSSSLGDFAEKQARQDSVQVQITQSTANIKAIKEQLESQKASIDALLAAAEASRSEITAKRNQQQALKDKYANDSAAYERDAAAARETMQREIAAEIARNNLGGIAGEGYNTYPWAANCPQDNVGYLVVGGYVCQCTSYAGWKAQEYWGIYISSWGDARNWGVSATARGYVVNDTPAAYTIGFSTAGYYGHVVWVESVNANGTINITEYNNSASSLSGLAGDFGARYNVPASAYRYIHLDQRAW